MIELFMTGTLFLGCCFVVLIGIVAALIAINVLKSKTVKEQRQNTWNSLEKEEDMIEHFKSATVEEKRNILTWSNRKIKEGSKEFQQLAVETLTYYIKDPKQRAWAWSRLHDYPFESLGGEDLLTTLLTFASAPKYSMYCMEAIQLLRRYDDPRIYETLLRTYAITPRDNIKKAIDREIIISLGQIGNEESLPILIGDLCAEYKAIHAWHAEHIKKYKPGNVAIEAIARFPKPEELETLSVSYSNGREVNHDQVIDILINLLKELRKYDLGNFRFSAQVAQILAILYHSDNTQSESKIKVEANEKLEVYANTELEGDEEGFHTVIKERIQLKAFLQPKRK